LCQLRGSACIRLLSNRRSTKLFLFRCKRKYSSSYAREYKIIFASTPPSANICPSST
jgi:hypothetical protein